MSKDKIIGFFPGVWDMLHPGHIRALFEAKRHCDRLYVGVNLSPTGKKPVMNGVERDEIVSAIKWVDDTLGYLGEKELHKIDLYDDIDIRFMGADHKEVHHPIKAKIIKISRDHDYSSSNIRERCRR